MSFENALKSVTQLVNDFNANENHYLNPAYSEADVRNDFINKFFIALGWNVRHETLLFNQLMDPSLKNLMK